MRMPWKLQKPQYEVYMVAKDPTTGDQETILAGTFTDRQLAIEHAGRLERSWIQRQSNVLECFVSGESTPRLWTSDRDNDYSLLKAA